VCDLETSRMRRLKPASGLQSKKKKKKKKGTKKYIFLLKFLK
jgi:hypothetical protein